MKKFYITEQSAEVSWNGPAVPSAELLTPAEAAKALKVSESWLAKEHMRGGSLAVASQRSGSTAWVRIAERDLLAEREV